MKFSSTMYNLYKIWAISAAAFASTTKSSEPISFESSSKGLTCVTLDPVQPPVISEINGLEELESTMFDYRTTVISAFDLELKYNANGNSLLSDSYKNGVPFPAYAVFGKSAYD